MLTRLKVIGFKNLVDTEIRFGPFTCIAGFNGVGKSNVFDAIHFLSLLADHTFIDAAKQTRGGGDLQNLFTSGGNSRMLFDCDMIVPKSGYDEFHQPANASQNFLNYRLELELKSDSQGFPRVGLLNETLEHIPKLDPLRSIQFRYDKNWWDSVVVTSNRRNPFISMSTKNGNSIVRLSADKMREQSKSQSGGGKPTSFLANTLPRTVLSAAQNADEARTAVLVRAEMRSWRIMQLEPTALRAADEFQSPDQLGTDGKHLPATLNRLAQTQDSTRVYTELANRLSQLVDDVRKIWVDRDEARRVLQLMVSDTGGSEFPASSLSDGTLRFIALCVLQGDPVSSGVVCLEEPENGIHPERVHAMTRLLLDMATDPQELVDELNPLRQVIVSTHSPVVVAKLRPDMLVFAERRDPPSSGVLKRNSLVMRPVRGTWRDKDHGMSSISKGDLLNYLGALKPIEDYDFEKESIYSTVAGQLNLFGTAK